jgi:GH35 family endo-1,4-beta-xylanase
MKIIMHTTYGKYLAGLLLSALVLFPPVTFAQQVGAIEKELMSRAEENIEKFRKGDVQIRFMDEVTGNSIQNARVEIRQETHDFLFGCIVFDLIRNENPYREDLFKERFRRIFNLAVFPFYWPGYEPVQGMPRWESMLPAIEWCQANGITTKGHPLVWACSSGTPQWLRNYSTSETEELLRARVLNIVSAFEDKIALWDVVNEPVNVKTWRNKVNNMDDPNDWGVEDPIEKIADYVENAILWAHQANPDATLVINEYRTIADLNVRQRYYDLLMELKERKAPFSDIGIQAHEPRQEWFNPEETWKTFDLYSDLGYTLHITEFHPQSSGVDITGGWRTGKWTLETQQEFTEQFVRLCFGHPAVASINWWGFSDRNIWLPGGGLVDEEYRPKPVYEMLDKLINETWRTNLEMESGKDGRIGFRGFYGKYKITLILPDGTRQVYPVHVRQDEANEWIFRVGL